MKHFFRSVAAVVAVAGMCYAADNPPAVPSPPAAVKLPANAFTVQGKIDSVITSNAPAGASAEIVLIEDNGQKMRLAVKSTTTIYGADWKAMALGQLQKDQRATVSYQTIPNGVPEALSIRLLKS